MYRESAVQRPMRKLFILVSFSACAAIVGVGTFWSPALYSLLLVGPLVTLGVYDFFQKKHALLRVYPLVGRGRYLLELFRPEIQQYFIESDMDGRPFSRDFRSVVYQRAKGARDTQAFGTQRNLESVGAEWVSHSLAPIQFAEGATPPRVTFGNKTTGCTQPYATSLLNISAMSFGSLSKNAIQSLSAGAKAGGFFHNTGEGGISPYHLAGGADLCWQVGTGYFGCRTPEGKFDEERFVTNSTLAQVKLIEIKLSQGAKPAHGGILPGGKVTREIANIRGVPIGETVISPPMHSAFVGPTGLLKFVERLRTLSGGKPIGFKLCLGNTTEFLGICKAMLETQILPDFITVDGAEGGTGAAPMELSNSVGQPMRDGLLLVHNALVGIGLREHIRIIAAGKLITGYHIFRTMALGADTCNSARGMMLALGCIQARRCNSNDCPVGVATQDPSRYTGLDVADKTPRVTRFQHATVHAFLELMGAAGIADPCDIAPADISKRVNARDVKTFAEIYEWLDPGALLPGGNAPKPWTDRMEHASTEQFR